MRVFFTILFLCQVVQSHAQQFNEGAWYGFNDLVDPGSVVYAFFTEDTVLHISGGIKNIISKGDTIFSRAYARYSPSKGWYSVGTNFPQSSWTSEISRYKYYVYVGGSFNNISHDPLVVRLDSIGYSLLDTNGPNEDRDVSMTVFQNKLFIAGSYPENKPLYGRNIVAWNDTSWVNVGGLYSDGVYDLEVVDFGQGERLIAGGRFSVAGDYPGGDFVDFAWNIAQYDGEKWDTIDRINGQQVNALVWDSVMNILYVGGFFDGVRSVYSDNVIAFDGENWHALKNGVGCGPYKKTMGIYHGELYVGGCVNSAGGKPANHITRWDGQRWDNMDEGVDPQQAVYAFGVYRDTLLVGGTFEFVGSQKIESRGMAKWYTSPCAYLKAGIGIDSINKNTYYFSDSSAGLWKTKWTWYLGDGSKDSVQNPTYTYAYNGTYNVRLIVGHEQCADTIDRIIEVTGGLNPGIENQSTHPNKNHFALYPNPSTGSISIELNTPIKNGTIEVYDTEGQLMEQKELSSHTRSIPLSNLPSGMYLVQVKDGKGIVLGVERLVVE